MVVLDCGEESGARVYEAACALKGIVGDRAFVLVAERVDIAAAVGASGVVLSDDAIPALVARKMMMKAKTDSVYLPLVARTVENIESAISAASSEGADFLIMSADTNNYATVLDTSLTQNVKVPIFFTIVNVVGDSVPLNVVSSLLQSGICGIVMSLNDIKLLSDDVLKKLFVKELEATNLTSYQDLGEKKDGSNTCNWTNNVMGFSKLGERETQLIQREKQMLNEVIAVIQKAAPMMKEVSLLVDAASRLTDPFLLVVVGEFNSGKSTVINALLGRKYLRDGVVPTTNEITLLSYSEMDSGYQHCERNPDGQFVCYLSSPVLKEMNLVDTPGTNVILQRQQRLTEEFVPRADLILFVLSADRPLTESEVDFLMYVQQWKKKVVFILNKMDIYRTTSELEEVIEFIKGNARQVLNAEDIRLFPVSARSALEAKLASAVFAGDKFGQVLVNDPRWLSSKFNEFEEFLFSFLDGSTETGLERVRLKLETPLAIADRLLSSCESLLKHEHDYVIQQLKSIERVRSSVKEFSLKVEKESISWRKQATLLIQTAKSRVLKLMESTLQLSNTNLIPSYAFRGEKSGYATATSAVQNEILIPTLSDAKILLEEYCAWLESTNADQAKIYEERFDEWSTFVDMVNMVHLEASSILPREDALSLKVIDGFNAGAAARIFEQEIREVVVGTFGGLGAAGLSASLLTSVLQTTLEDLLALGLCSAGGFLAISNFPGRRKEAMEKVGKVADNFLCELDEAMQKDIYDSTQKLDKYVETLSAPYIVAAQKKIDHLMEVRNQLTIVEQSVQEMKVSIQNLHASERSDIVRK